MTENEIVEKLQESVKLASVAKTPRELRNANNNFIYEYVDATHVLIGHVSPYVPGPGAAVFIDFCKILTERDTTKDDYFIWAGGGGIIEFQSKDRSRVTECRVLSTKEYMVSPQDNFEPKRVRKEFWEKEILQNHINEAIKNETE